VSYVIATNERLVRWYQFMDLRDPRSFVLHERLDMHVVNQFKDRETARATANAAGINGNYRFVRL
jgi:hypothetical protein